MSYVTPPDGRPDARPAPAPARARRPFRDDPRLLMFDFVRKHTRLLQFLLLIVILPSFVLVGVEGYSRFMEGGNTAVASVDGHKITQSEWDAALRQQVERMRQQAPTMDAPASRRAGYSRAMASGPSS